MNVDKLYSWVCLSEHWVYLYRQLNLQAPGGWAMHASNEELELSNLQVLFFSLTYDARTLQSRQCIVSYHA